MLDLDNDSREINSHRLLFSLFFHFFIWLAILILTGCGTFGSTLNTQVTGTENTISLTWDKKHPMAKQLQQDSYIRLRADYRYQGKPLSEVLAAASGNLGHKVVFVLPNQLKAGYVPDSEVCLYIQLSNRQIPVLPVRTVSATHIDTGGFRYPIWEQMLKENMQRVKLEQMRPKLEYELQSIQTQLSDSEQNLREQGVRKIEDCSQFHLQQTKMERPSDVVDRERHDGVTRKICINKAKNIIEPLAKNNLNILEFIVATRENVEALPLHREQAKIFIQDWNKWRSNISVEYQPEVDAADALLPFSESSFSFLLKSVELSINSSVVNTIVDTILDAYDGCIEDTRKQLMTKLNAWNKRMQSKPERDQAYIEYVIQQCRQEIAKNEKRKNRIRELQKEIGVYQTQTITPQTILSKNRQALNLQTCDMR